MRSICSSTPFGSLLGLLLFRKQVIKDTNNFGLLIYLRHIKPICSDFFSINIRLIDAIRFDRITILLG